MSARSVPRVHERGWQKEEKSRIQRCDFDQLREERGQLKCKGSQHNAQRDWGGNQSQTVV